MKLHSAVSTDKIATQDRSGATAQRLSKPAGMIDNRVVASAQLQRQSLSDQSQQATQLRKHLASLNQVAQRVEDDELVQGKFETAQRVEEEEALQGKFDIAQRVEDEELVQGKFETAQRVEDEEPLQGKFTTVQRAEDEDLLQGKFDTAQRMSVEEPRQAKSADAFPTQLAEQANAKPNNTGLPDQLKSGIESLSGISMNHVKVHYNSSQPAQLNAHAYAQGSEIHVAPGQEKHLPHEAWHVVQQAQGRVKPTMQMEKGVPVNDDVGLETEADVMGAKAAVVGTAQVKSLNSDVVSMQNVEQSVAQRVTGQAGLDEIKSTIFRGTTQSQQIATDIYGVEVGAQHDGDFTVNTQTKIRQSALVMGYADEYATRLANNNPFVLADIDGKTAWEDQSDRHVNSFDFSFAINDPRGDVVSIHQLNFENLYADNGDTIFRFNSRNPALANFYASDVVTVQKEWIRNSLGQVQASEINTVTRENVQSVSGQQWRVRHPGWGRMSNDALQDFLANTVNGQSTVAMLRGRDLIITEGEVLRYDGPTDPEWSVKLTVEEPMIPTGFFS